MTNLIPDQATSLLLAAIAVHADELTSPNHENTKAAIEADQAAIRGLLSNPMVQDYLNGLPGVMLPVKRSDPD